MNKTIWKQADSRWGKKPYPTKSCTMSGAGCGCVACTHVAMEQERYKNWTPESLRPWMVSKGFAIAGQGTRWEGITETLKHLGHTNVVRIYSDPMSVAWKELNKGNRIGVLLFNSRKAPNGVRWTSCGHYVAFTDYKVQNGKHYFYCKDSGGRNHDGWYTYENSMKGCIAKVWIVERVGAQVKSDPPAVATIYRPTTAYKGSLPGKTVKNGTKGADAKAVQTFLNWCINSGLNVDGNIGPKSVAAIKVFQKTYGLVVDGIFGSASKSTAQSIINQHKPTPSPAPVTATAQQKMVAWAKSIAADNNWHYVKWNSKDSKTKECPICKKHSKGKYHGWNCIGFSFAAWHHGAGIKCKCNNHVISNDIWEDILNAKTDAAALKIVRDRAGIKDIKVIRNKKGIPQSQLQAGDICGRFDGKKCGHIFLYIGNGKMADARGSSGKVPNDKQISVRAAQTCKVAIRYIGK